ncbi:MAG TPA: TIM barrel protein [Eoetvoesiella sp.]
MKLAANLSMLYGHLPVAERFAAAAHDGFRYVEILFPYDKSPHWYAQRLKEHQLQLVLINTPVFRPEFPLGMAAQPQAASQFRQAFAATLEVCAATGCKAVHVMAGPRNYSLSPEGQLEVLVNNLNWASIQNDDVVLQLEALNENDVPDYFYSTPRQTLTVLRACEKANLGLQFDFYHVVKQGLNLDEQLLACLPWIRHIQLAGSPQRHEPALEADGLLQAFKRLHEADYKGFVGCEYRPRGQVADGLVWMRPLLNNNWASLN